MAYHFNKAFYQKQLLAAIEKRDSLQIDVYREHLFAARRNQDLFIQQLKIDYPKYFQLKYDQQTAKLTEIQKYLPSKTVMLEYFIANEYIHIFTISKSGVQLSSVFKAPLFETGLNQFLQHLQQAKKQYLHKLQQEQDKVRQLTAHPYYWASFVGLGNYDAL